MAEFEGRASEERVKAAKEAALRDAESMQAAFKRRGSLLNALLHQLLRGSGFGRGVIGDGGGSSSRPHSLNQSIN